MKKMKKLLSMALVCMMALSMVVTVSAVGVTYNETNGTAVTNGTITIDGIHTDSSGTAHTEYKIYKMLHLSSYNAVSDAYSYLVIDEWEDFFKTGAGKDYMTIDGNGYVTWTNASKADSVVAEFAKKALEYAEAKNISPVMTSKNDYDEDTQTGYKVTGTTGVFHGLSLGYYLVDSNVGALCGLTTTQPNGTIQAKNGAPTVDKEVQEDSLADSSSNSWYDNNDADINQYVNFDATITVHAGAQDYVFHDKMSAGLTFVHDKDHGVASVLHRTAAGIETTLTEGDDYEVITNATDITDGCTFEIRFTQTLCDKLKTNDSLIITYDALLNENAVIGGPNDSVQGNVNEAWLDYGEGHTTTHDTTTTYTYGFEIVKTDSANNLLDGASFKLYEQDGTTVVELVKQADGSYRRAVADDGDEDVTEIIEVSDGRVKVVGFDDGTYYLEEITAPNGYNLLSERTTVTISDGNLYALMNGDTYSSGGVHVVNSKGDILPSTGAKGTAMFIGFGAALVIGTGLLLVTKKRMSMIED